MNVSVVGIGGIGLPMALRIAAAGYSVTGIDVSHGVRTTAEKRGIRTAGNLMLAPCADVVIVTTASPRPFEKIVDKAAPGFAGQRWIVTSTIGPSNIRAQSQRLRAVGVHVVDAPVIGDMAQAESGELQIFAAGDTADIAAVHSILDAIGNVSMAGVRVGDAQSMAIVNQHLCKVHVVAAAEALSLAGTLGLDIKLALDVLGNAGGGSRMLSDRGPRMLGPTSVRVANTLGISTRDCELVADIAAASGAEVPLFTIALRRYRQAVEAGLGRRDDSRVIEVCCN